MMNKNFKDVLIASDWDNTLFCNNTVSEENKSAIKRFIDGGGFFAVASGRSYDFLTEIPIETNTYNICINGAYIANTKTGEVLFSNPCDENVFYIVKEILEDNDEFESATLVLASEEKRYSEIICYQATEFLEKFDTLKKSKVAKIVLRAKDISSAQSVLEKIKNRDFGDYVVERSWATGFEFLHKNNRKGIAIKRLADAIGAKKIIAVGDYENDLSMIKAADIGYAVANATESLLAAADRITVPCTESAIAKIISDLETE